MGLNWLSRVRFGLTSQVKRHPRLYDILLYLRHSALGKSSLTHSCLAAYSRSRTGPVSFLQIGANDGLWYDPIRYFAIWKNWTGALCEPLPESFEQLKENYRSVESGRLTFAKVAVHAERDGELTLFRVSESGLSKHRPVSQKSLLRKTSFSRKHLERFVHEKKIADIVKIKVPALTIPSLWRAYGTGSASPDVLVMDLEGYEQDVLLGEDFVSIRPSLIVFEIANSEVDVRKKIFRKLEKDGYLCMHDFPDAVAIRKDILSEGIFDSLISGKSSL